VLPEKMSSKTKLLSTLIVDDHELIRLGVELKLKETGLFRYIHHASNGKDAVERIRNHEYDIIFMDIAMPVMDGIRATNLICTLNKGIKVIALSSISDKNYIYKMIEAGAYGYLTKEADADEITDAVQSIQNDTRYFSKRVATYLLDEQPEVGKELRQFWPVIELSPREIDVIKLICQEFTTKEIAALLKLNIKTIEKYREKLLQKTGAKNLAGLVMFAVSRGIVMV
jgi:DNA-binding NarL/FixJ family response regulator